MYVGNSNLIDICGSTVWQASNGAQSGPVSFGSPLPVELLYFHAKCNNGAIKFEWMTATELDNDYFEIQGSQTGENFETIAIISGAGTSATPISYNYTWKGNNMKYFRLKQTDFDGAFEYFSVVATNCSDSDFLVYPNPVSVSEQITIAGAEINEIEIYSVDGRFIKSLKIHGNQVNIPAQEFENAGVYLLHLISDFEPKTIQLVVYR